MRLSLSKLFFSKVLVGLLLFSTTANSAPDDYKIDLQVVSFKKLGDDNSFYWKTETMKGAEEQPQVRASSNTLLPPVKYKGPGVLTLMSHVTEKEYKPLVSVKLPSSKRAIVILIPNAKDSDMPFKAIALSGDLRDFKAGTRKIINLSPVALRGQMGSLPFVRNSKKNVSFVCKSNGMSVVPVLDPNAAVLASQPVIIEYLNADKKWRTLSSTRWFHTPTQRHLVFVFYDGGRKNLSIRGISETVAADDRDIAANRMSEEEDPEAKERRMQERENEKATNPRR